MVFPPLVSEGSELSAAEQRRTARQRQLLPLGDSGQRRLANARVAVIGAGGIGAPVILYLAAAGTGSIGIIDDDVVDESNLHRQVIFASADVGRPKAEVAAARAKGLSPSIQTITHRERLTADNAVALLSGHDLVIDGSDNFGTRYAVADACDELGIPLVWGSVLRFDAQVSVFWSQPPAGSPVRLRDVFPAPPPEGSVPTCAEAGVLGSLCGQVGSLLVTEAIKLICGIGESVMGRMLVLDGLGATMREIPLVPMAPPAPATSSPPSPRLADAIRPEELALFDDVVLVDVRETEEYAAGTIPGAVSLPLSILRSDTTSVPQGPLVVFCQRGPRAREAVRIIAAARPETKLRLLAGGYEAWPV